MNDLRYALRTLLKNCGFAVIAILTLALGIGANTAIFSVVNGVLLRPLPYPDAGAIVQVFTTSSGEARSNHTPADFLEFQRNNRTLLKMAGYREDALNVVAAGSAPVRFSGALVTIDFFDVFWVPAALGRTFLAADAAANEPLVVLSDSAWTQLFSRDPSAVSRRVRINGVVHTIVGVMPAAFAYPEDSKAWVLSPRPVPLPPLDVEGDLLETRGVHYFKAVGRLRPGVSAEQARGDLTVLADDQARRFPQSNAGRGVAIELLEETIVGGVRGALYVLLGAVGVVLLIACANVASLLLARASGRRRELAIRAALGARRGRLVRQLMTESLLLGGAGAAAGLLAGTWAIALLLKMLPDGIPRVLEIRLDARVAGAAIAVSLLSALLFGLAPALQASRADASSALRDADRTSTGGTRRAKMRAVLVVCQIALTLILLVSAGLLVNSFVRLYKVDPGFRVEEVTLLALPLPQSKYTDGKRQAAFYQRLLEAVEQQPQIQSAAILFPNPIKGGNANGTVSIEGQPTSTRADRPFTAIAAVYPQYFRTLGIPLLQGRTFSEQDREPAPAAAIVNATFVRKYLAGRDPIGIRVRFGDEGDDWITIVGVAGDSRNMGLRDAPTPVLYLPYHSFPLPFMSIATRSAASPSAVTSIVRSEIGKIDPDLPVDRIVPMREVLQDSVAEPRFRTLLLSLFALMATALAAVGVYGLMSYSVTQRTREIGIRVALGAQARQVMGPMLREGMTLALLGVTVGLGGSLVASRALGGFLFGIGATDPLTYTSVALLLLAVAFIASYIPSRRALRVDPITALRSE